MHQPAGRKGPRRSQRKQGRRVPGTGVDESPRKGILGSSRSKRNRPAANKDERLFELIKGVHEEAVSFRNDAIKSIDTLFKNNQELLRGLFSAELNLRAAYRVIDDLTKKVMSDGEGPFMADGGRVSWPAYHQAIDEEIKKEEEAALALEKKEEDPKPKEESPFPEGATIFGGDIDGDSNDEE